MDSFIIITLAFAVGGILKGATGAGAPLLAIPLMAIFFDMPFAVAVFTLPNLVPNFWQAWAYRHDHMPWSFVCRFAIAGAAGAAVGTYFLATISTSYLSLTLAVVVLGYVWFRLAQPTWHLKFSQAAPLAVPVGLIAGVLQGGAGLSAPASLTYLTAMRLERAAFISTISIFFASVGLVQVPMLIAYDMMTPRIALISLAAILPLVAFMPVGARLARHISRERFEQILLVILTLISLKLLVEFAL